MSHDVSTSLEKVNEPIIFCLQGMMYDDVTSPTHPPKARFDWIPWWITKESDVAAKSPHPSGAKIYFLQHHLNIKNKILKSGLPLHTEVESDLNTTTIFYQANFPTKNEKKWIYPPTQDASQPEYYHMFSRESL